MLPQYQIPSYEAWLKGTYAFGKPRSQELKALDDALQDYNKSIFGREAKLRVLSDAFSSWKRKEGPEWKDSARNKTGLLTQIDDFFNA